MALQPEGAACAKALRQEDSRQCHFWWEEEDTSGKYCYWNSSVAGLSILLLSLHAPLDGLLAPVNNDALSYSVDCTGAHSLGGG